MKKGPVWLSGGTGLVGNRLVEALCERGQLVELMTRRPKDVDAREGVVPQDWNGTFVDPESVRGCSAAIHLAGEPVFGGLPTRKRLAAVRNSRIDSTRALVAAMREVDASERPSVLICASAVGYYGDQGEEALDESAPMGEGFLAEVCRDWEAEAAVAEELGVRVVSLRIGVVMAADGGALGPLLPQFRAGLGGPIGGGRQWFPWIQLDDLVRLILFALDRDDVRGVLNAVAPIPVRQGEFAGTLGRTLGRPALVPVPAFAIRLAMGDISGELLGSRRVLPQKALAAGFQFRFPTLEQALAHELGAPEATDAP
ncbi:MAG: TIGR01777 family oxidoreductase [Myxococcota bacterium]|nr:TIGR01777 family oxidoreductase [Myxococcota bacterium]